MTKVACYNTKLQDSTLSGTSVTLTLEDHPASILILLMIGNYKAQKNSMTYSGMMFILSLMKICHGFKC